MGIVTSAGEPKISQEQNFLAEIPTRKKKMILLVAILAFGGLAIDAETTPDYGDDPWGGTPPGKASPTPDPWPPSAARCRRLEEEEEKAKAKAKAKAKEWSYCNDLLHPWYPTTSVLRRMNNPAKNDGAKEMKKIRAEVEKLKKDHVQQMVEMRAEIARMKKAMMAA